MTFLILISYMILGIVLYFGMLLLKKKYQLRKIDDIFISLSYFLVVAGIFLSEWEGFNNNLFIIFIFTFLCDLIYTTYFLEKDFFDKSKDNIFYYIVLVCSGFLLNQGFINKVDAIFPTGEDLRIILWLLLIIYVYQFAKGKEIFNDDNFNNKNVSLDDEYIIVSYAKLKHRFLDDLNFSNKDLELSVFAIMIYENYRCPQFVRRINNLLFKLDDKPRKLGIMQVESKKFISDIESIEIVYKKMEKLISGKNKRSIIEAISSYMKEDSLIVIDIYDQIKKFSKN